jgi:hypothetical protein
MLWLILGQSSGDEPKYLLFLLAWLAGAAISGYLSERKGYGEKSGVVTGLCLSIIGAIVWVFIPPRANSDWKLKGAFGSQRTDSASAPVAPQPSVQQTAPPSEDPPPGG